MVFVSVAQHPRVGPMGHTAYALYPISTAATLHTPASRACHWAAAPPHTLLRDCQFLLTSTKLFTISSFASFPSVKMPLFLMVLYASSCFPHWSGHRLLCFTAAPQGQLLGPQVFSHSALNLTDVCSYPSALSALLFHLLFLVEDRSLGQ